MTTKEFRGIAQAELRAVAGRRIEGYAAVFNELSEDLGGFRERIRRGAFSQSLRNGADVRALIDHEPSLILGRTKAGTLQLREDERGLHFSVEVPRNATGEGILESVSRGDVDQCSFAFRVRKDAWPFPHTRELLEVDLFDVSVVTYPAYPQTTVAVRGWYAGVARRGGGYRPDPRLEAMNDQQRRLWIEQTAREIEEYDRNPRTAAAPIRYVSLAEQRDQQRRRLIAKWEREIREDRKLIAVREEEERRQRERQKPKGTWYGVFIG